MKRIFEQIFQKPYTAFVSGIGLLTERIKARQKVDGVISRFIHLINRRQLSNEADLPVDEMASGEKSFTQSVESKTIAEDRNAKYDNRTTWEKKPDFEEKRDMDQDLRDDKLKLVRYKVLFIKRDYEHAFAENEDLVSENIDGRGFTAWKIAEFIQKLAERNTKIPKKWQTKNYPPPEYRDGSMLIGLPDEDKKYLRVFHGVSDRYQREKFEYEEEQIDVLREIRDEIRNRKNS